MEHLKEEGKITFEKKSCLDEVSKEIFDVLQFGEGDIILADNDEALTPTWENFLLRKPFDVLPKDSQNFLCNCKEKGIPLAIVTNMPREKHYMNHTTTVFGYDHFFENKFLRKMEFPLTLFLGSLYKQTQKSLCELAWWISNEGGEKGRVAWVGNSYLDQGFGIRLEKVLRDFEFDGDFHMYKLPTFRSFSKR